MNRITMRDLEATVRRINDLAGTPHTCWVKTENVNRPFTANIGCYHLSGAYGGYSLVQMVNDGGGERTIIGGHMPKRELYERMHAFIRGLETNRSA